MTKKEKQLSKSDQESLKEARELVELFKSKGYQEYLRPFLFTLAQDSYPLPKDFDSNEKLILAYTNKCGETEAVKKIMFYVEGAEQTIKTINKKIDGKTDFQVGVEPTS